MKQVRYSLCIVFILLLSGFVPEDTKVIPPSDLTLQIQPMFGKEKLQLNQIYTTLLGDKISITRFKFYLSNIALTKADGSIWRQKNSYHLIEISEDTEPVTIVSLPDVPPGKYTKLSFAIGVDSLNNHSGEQAGVLDPDYGMFWMWETGYVFFKCEGFYHQPDGAKGPIVYHIGREQCYRQVTLNLKELTVSQNSSSTLQIQADAARVFGGFSGAALDVKMPTDQSSVSVMGGKTAPSIASNYREMFVVIP
ncbi:hypothetical protein GXP67_17855 [Rhodocytophaga rosea]|uniref:Copper-binding protein MbnP-like domain-containing protein n=1 Tax=Rhodocytophaga rosea TaxID=2704465 RepID=A0A6C0GL57_9BACT|nr:MbnP family protein [Rhodocytophaga rosea]QHT68372.1 hypothetical protein GXP67_17855 [Rhodocytophaga rosea]